jgi:hypothetical protein
LGTWSSFWPPALTPSSTPPCVSSSPSFYWYLFDLYHSPNMMLKIKAQRKDISYNGCLTQVYFLIIFFWNG